MMTCSRMKMLHPTPTPVPQQVVVTQARLRHPAALLDTRHSGTCCLLPETSQAARVLLMTSSNPSQPTRRRSSVALGPKSRKYVALLDHQTPTGTGKGSRKGTDNGEVHGITTVASKGQVPHLARVRSVSTNVSIHSLMRGALLCVPLYLCR